VSVSQKGGNQIKMGSCGSDNENLEIKVDGND